MTFGNRVSKSDMWMRMFVFTSGKAVFSNIVNTSRICLPQNLLDTSMNLKKNLTINKKHIKSN